MAKLEEYPAGCTTGDCSLVVATFPLGQYTPFAPSGMAVDTTGNIFFAEVNTAQAYEVPRSQAPSLTFASHRGGQHQHRQPANRCGREHRQSTVDGFPGLELRGKFRGGSGFTG